MNIGFICTIEGQNDNIVVDAILMISELLKRTIMDQTIKQGINVPLTNRWNVCYEFRLQAGWNSYYMFENQ